MDQMPRENEGRPNTNLFGDNQNYNYDLFATGNDPSFSDASWGLNASNYSSLSRAPSSQPPSWPQGTAHHLSASNTPNSFHGSADLYGQSPTHSPAPFNQSAAYGGFNGHNFQYQQQHYSQPLPQNNNHGFQNYNNTQPSINTTIAPQTLTPRDQPQVPRPAEQSTAVSYASPPVQHSAAQQKELVQSIPASEQNGRFSTIDFAKLVQATNSERIAHFAQIGRQPQEFPVNRSTALPAYTKRYSRNELKQLAKNDPKLLSRLSGKSSGVVKTSSNAGSPAASGTNDSRIKYEGDSSSSDDSSEESDVSLYSDDEEDDSIGAPLPSKRPDDDPKASVEYDTIKALWRTKKKPVDPASIRKGLGDFWEIAKTVRDRWKTDTEAVKEAESKKRVGDLPLLKSRVKAQREMMEVAFKAAAKHGCKQIVELFSENPSLLFVCYQFLVDRVKADDVNGTLPHAIFEVLLMTTSITKDKLEKTNLGKALDRYLKVGHAKTKFYAKKILDNAAAASAKSKEAAKSEPEPTAGVKRSSSVAGNTTAAVVTKKSATANGTTTAAATSKTAPAVKKPATSSEPLKKTTATATTSNTKKVVNAKPSGFFSLQSAGKKPGTSNAEKTAVKPAEKKSNLIPPPKPAFNLAETLANLSKPKEEPKKSEPKPETPGESESPEKKAKRAARLARGASNVRFRDGTDLVQIRYFTHDPAEEVDHDASQMRDVKDVAGEGRMLKEHKAMMDIDDEDESGSEDDKNKFVAFTSPSNIDFSVIEAEERDRLFAPYGGGKLQVDSPENEVRKQYEANNLIVFYNDPREIPPNPREPVDPHNGDQGKPISQFGAPPEKCATRAREKMQQRAAHAFKKSSAPAANFDLSALAAFARPQQQPQSQQPAPPAGTPNIQEILAQLQANGVVPPQPPKQMQTAPPMQNPPFSGFPGQPPFNFAPPPQAPPPQPNGEPDISAILAALTKSNAAAPPANNYQAYPTMMAFTPSATANANPSSNSPADNPWYKTKTCKYWQEGKCRKGADCSYLHE